MAVSVGIQIAEKVKLGKGIVEMCLSQCLTEHSKIKAHVVVEVDIHVFLT